MNGFGPRTLFSLVALGLFNCVATRSSQYALGVDGQPLNGPMLGQQATAQPQLLAPGVVSRPFQELNAALSPDQNLLFFTLADATRSHYTLLLVRRLDNGQWSTPQVAPFSGTYADADPAFSPDGKRLYFISRRPRAGAKADAKDFNIWYVERLADSWGEPVDLGSDLNTAGDEFYVSVTQAGVVYTSREGKVIRAIPKGSGFEIETLGEAVNAPKTYNGDAVVSADESVLVFTSWGRKEGLGEGDLYASFKVNGTWTAARNVGAPINSEANEYCPMLSADGQYFFFTSYKSPKATVPTRRTLEQIVDDFSKIENGLGNVYFMKTDFLQSLRSAASAP